MSDPHASSGSLRPDLERLRSRRTVLGWLGAVAAAPLAACSTGSASDNSSDTATSGWSMDDDTCAEIPPETAGPFPGDGSNGPDALGMDDIVRSDIRSSIGDATGTASGVLLRLRMRLVDVDAGCAPLAGLAVYVWHCDADGAYSMYTLPDENYLRGVQHSDADGWVVFTTIFPGCYPGRWPHVHFEVYASLDDLSQPLATSQLAFPQAECDAVYATNTYAGNAENLAKLSLETDGVFADDGGVLQLAAMSGSVQDGLEAGLEVGLSTR